LSVNARQRVLGGGAAVVPQLAAASALKTVELGDQVLAQRGRSLAEWLRPPSRVVCAALAFKDLATRKTGRAPAHGSAV